MHAMAHSKVSWLFDAAKRIDDLWWQDMSVGAQLLCEHCLQSSKCGDGRVYFCHRNVLYTVGLVAMTQRNLSTGRIRRIKRVEEPFSFPKHRVPLIRTSPDACHVVDIGFRETEPFREARRVD